MATAEPRSATLEEAIFGALDAGDEERAAGMLRRAFGRRPLAGAADLSELLEELAEYYASQDRPEDALALATRVAMMSSQGSEPSPDALRRRCRVAEMLLRCGLSEEACAVYAAIVEEAPGETWVHEAAGSDYADAGDHELAFAWLTAGLELAMLNSEANCAARLLWLRRMSMAELDLPLDDLDREATELIKRPSRPSPDADDLHLLVELEGEGVAPERALRLLACLRQAQDDADQPRRSYNPRT